MDYRTAEVSLDGGRSVTVRACPPAVLFQYIRKWVREHPEPQPPVRETETADGAVEKFELGKDDPLYGEYEAAHMIWLLERQRRWDVGVLVSGVIIDPPEDDEWADQYKTLRLEIPDREKDFPDYKYCYLVTIVFPNKADADRVVEKILELSLPQEARIRDRMRGFPLSGTISRLWRLISRRDTSQQTSPGK